MKNITTFHYQNNQPAQANKFAIKTKYPTGSTFVMNGVKYWLGNYEVDKLSTGVDPKNAPLFTFTMTDSTEDQKYGNIATSPIKPNYLHFYQSC